MHRTKKSFRRIIGQPGLHVKAQIVSEGIKLTHLAAAAGIKPSTLSNCLAGRRRRRLTQEAIWLAFRQLSGCDTDLQTFWGDLLTYRMRIA